MEDGKNGRLMKMLCIQQDLQIEESETETNDCLHSFFGHQTEGHSHERATLHREFKMDLYVYLLFITLYFCLLIKIFSSPNTEHFPNSHGKIHTGTLSGPHITHYTI